MKKYTLMPVLVAPALLFAIGAAQNDDESEQDVVALGEAEVFIEFNSTDMDFGIHFFWDGDPWKRMKVVGPAENTMLNIKSGTNLALHGLTEGFFESAEPNTSVLSMEEFFERFPEGEYEYEGTTLEGNPIEGETEFTHTLPAPPENLFPPEGAMVNSAMPLVVSFDAVTEDLNGNPLTPELYDVVVETENEILRVFSLTLEGDEDEPSVTVPPEIVEPGLEYKLEVLVQEESGNRTISETKFTTF